MDSGSLVLIDGASGGVGMAGVELAKAMGARVIAGVSTPEKQGPPTVAGADRVLCYGKDRGSYRKFKNDVRQALVSDRVRASVESGDVRTHERDCVKPSQPGGNLFANSGVAAPDIHAAVPQRLTELTVAKTAVCLLECGCDSSGIDCERHVAARNRRRDRNV